MRTVAECTDHRRIMNVWFQEAIKRGAHKSELKRYADQYSSRQVLCISVLRHSAMFGAMYTEIVRDAADQLERIESNRSLYKFECEGCQKCAK